MKVSANTAKVLKYLEKRETSNVNVTFFQHLQKSTVMKTTKPIRMVLWDRMKFLWLGGKKQQTEILPLTEICFFFFSFSCLNKLRSKFLKFPNSTRYYCIWFKTSGPSQDRARTMISERTRSAVIFTGCIHLKAMTVLPPNSLWHPTLLPPCYHPSWCISPPPVLIPLPRAPSAPRL